MDQQADEGLVRGIRRWDLVAMAINAIIGAGIFGLPSKVYGLIGAYSLVAFVVCTLVVALIILCFAEVGSRFGETGGPYLYAREVFGPVVGFEVGWLLWLARLTAFAANCNLLVGYLSYFWPAVNAGPWRAVVILTVVISLTIINIAGVRGAAITGDVFTVGKLIPMIFFVATGLFFINTQSYSFATKPSYGAFSTSVLLLVYAFTGFEMATIPAGEIRDPRRNLPTAIFIALGVVALLYILIQIVCIGTLPGLADSERPLADAGSRFLGMAGASVISAGALVSIIGNLNVTMLAGSRLPFAMAERRQLPILLSATHRRFRTPYISIALTAVVMLALTLSGTFIYALTISTIARLIIYATTCAALPVMRRQPGAPPALFKAPGGVVVSVAALALAAWLLLNSTGREARDAGIAAALGLLICFAYRLKWRGAHSERTVTSAQ